MYKCELKKYDFDKIKITCSWRPLHDNIPVVGDPFMIILTRGEGRTVIYVKTVDSKGRVRVKLSSSGFVSHILNIHYNPVRAGSTTYWVH